MKYHKCNPARRTKMFPLMLENENDEIIRGRINYFIEIKNITMCMIECEKNECE